MDEKALPATAAVPSEEEVARAIYNSKPRNRPWDILPHEFKNQYRKQARKVAALFAPILAEKERRGAAHNIVRETFAYYVAESVGGLCKIPRRVADDMAQSYASLEARALAAEAAVLAVAPYVDSIVCYASTVDEHDGNRVAKLANEAAAAIRAQIAAPGAAMEAQ